MTADLIRMHAVVAGRVQGVGYRYFTRDCAGDFNITGWVRNLYDGSVELEAQGRRSDVEAFMEEVGQGPQLSHVTSVKSAEMPAIPGESEFHIRH